MKVKGKYFRVSCYQLKATVMTCTPPSLQYYLPAFSRRGLSPREVELWEQERGKAAFGAICPASSYPSVSLPPLPGCTSKLVQHSGDEQIEESLTNSSISALVDRRSPSDLEGISCFPSRSGTDTFFDVGVVIWLCYNTTAK